ncbi:MAG: DUF3443 family protein [Oligoflexia bacterium]|nr:DUF3443 family protein [Oligoflexia bacterium]
MISNKRAITALLIFAASALSGCQQSAAIYPANSSSSGSWTSTTSSTSSGGTTSTPVGGNIMTITVNGSLCGANQYANEPCVSVTLCAAGNPNNCQTIDNILLDTGSYGLRIFQSQITVPLTPITNSSGASLAECVQFGDGSTEWGPVQYADVKLGNEPAIEVPVLTIDSTYATPPAICSSSQSTPDTSPSEAGFNGILGVGLLAQDCGTYCAQTASNGMYYACSGTTCSQTTIPLAQQVTNPVSKLPTDNNGVIVELPGGISLGGTSSVTGTLIFGIGTQTNNIPSGVTAFEANSSAEFTSVFSAYSSAAIPSFIDSGSSILFMPPASSLPACNTAAGGSHTGSGYSSLYCPSSNIALSSTNYSATGSVNGNVSFDAGNAYNLFNSGNSVFINMVGNGGSGSSAIVDWGLPFFFGRNVYVGIENTQSALGTGPYWAY